MMFAKFAEQALPEKKYQRKTEPEFDESEIGKHFHSYFYSKPKPSNDLSFLILKTLFNSENYEIAAQEVFQGVKNSKAICAKIFNRQDIAFKCLDCEKASNGIICKDCYEKGDHKGHRVLPQKNIAGCCDCGDSDVWNERGFCSEHPGYAKFKPTYSVNDLPETLKQGFLLTFEKCFYFLFLFYEEFGISKKDDKSFQFSLDYLVEQIFIALDFCGDKSMALWILLCQLFRTKLSEKNRALHVNTNDLKTMSFEAEAHPCDFTFFECLLYFHQFNSDKIHRSIAEECMKLFVDYQFKIYIAETYIKMIHFIFPNEAAVGSATKEYKYTKLTGLNVQLSITEEFAIIESNSPHFSAFLDLFEDILKFSLFNPSTKSFKTTMEYCSFFMFASQKQLSRNKLLYTEDFIVKLLDWLNMMNYCFKIRTTKKLNRQDIDGTDLLVKIEHILLQLTDHFFAELSSEPDQEKKTKAIEKITEFFVRKIQKNDLKAFEDHQEFDQFRSFHIPLYRSFALFVKNMLEEPTADSLDKLLKETMKISEKNLESIAHFLFKMALRTLTFIIDNEKKGWEFHSPLFDRFSSMYRDPKLKFIDCDILLLQLSLIYMNPDDFCLALQNSVSVNQAFRNLFAGISDGKFQEEKFLKNIEEIHKLMEMPQAKNGWVVINSPLDYFKLLERNENDPKYNNLDILVDEFFTLILLLCIDEVALTNLFYQKTKMFEEVKHPNFCKEVYKDVLINLFQKQNKMSFKTIKENLSNRITHEEADIENSLNEIANFSTSTKTFTLKDALMNVYEPFIFARDPQLTVEIHEAIQNRSKTNKTQANMIIGSSSHVYEYKRSIPVRIQAKVFETPLIEFAVNCLINSQKITTKPSLMLKPILKLFHMALNFGLHFKKTALLKTLAKSFDNKQLIDKMNELRNDANCIELHSNIDIILQLIAQIQSTYNSKGEGEVSETIFDPNRSISLLDKQEAIKIRIADLKSHFSDKRQAFLKNFKHEMEEDTPDEEVLQCCICHSQITGEMEYGIPGFFAESTIYNLAFAQLKHKLLSQNAQDSSEEMLIEDTEMLPKSEKDALRSYPVITPCSHNFHYIHRECFEKHGRIKSNSNASNDLEYSCPFCKSICNVFVPERKPQSKQTEERKVDENTPAEEVIKDLVLFLELIGPASNDPKIVCDPIFNDVMLLEVINDNLKKKSQRSKSKDEDFILVIFDKLLAESCYTVVFGGIEYFTKHKHNIYRSLRDCYKDFYRSHESKTKASYYDDQRMILIEYIRLLLAGPSMMGEPRHTKLLFKDCGDLKPAVFSTPDEFLFQALQHIVIATKFDQKVAHAFIEKVLKLYLVHKMVQVYIKKKVVKGEEVSFEHFMKDLGLSLNSPIKEEVVNGLLPSIRKVLVFMLLNYEVNQETISRLEKGDYNNDEQEFNSYLMIEGLSTTVTEFLSPKVFQYAGISEEIVRNWLNSVTEISKGGIQSLPVYLQLVDQDPTFSFPEIPDNFHELSTTFIEKKCGICKGHPTMGNQCLCLLCNMVLCSVSCNKGDLNTSLHIGNLNSHAMSHHAGEGVFLNVETGRIYLVQSPKNVDYAPLYVDRFGYEVGEEKGKDWKNFMLDKACFNKLREKLIFEKIAQEVSYNIMNNNKKLDDSYL